MVFRLLIHTAGGFVLPGVILDSVFDILSEIRDAGGDIDGVQ